MRTARSRAVIHGGVSLPAHSPPTATARAFSSLSGLGTACGSLGERSAESKDENERFSRVERSHGVFYRRFALPESANPEGIVANGKHGVLEIAIPKRPETTPRRIQVQ